MGEGEYESKVKKIVEKFEGVIDASESICKRIAEAECEMDKQRVKLLDKVEESGVGDVAAVAKALRAAQDSITNAQVALLTTEPHDFEAACQRASDHVGDLSEVAGVDDRAGVGVAVDRHDDAVAVVVAERGRVVRAVPLRCGGGAERAAVAGEHSAPTDDAGARSEVRDLAGRAGDEVGGHGLGSPAAGGECLGPLVAFSEGVPVRVERCVGRRHGAHRGHHSGSISEECVVAG